MTVDELVSLTEALFFEMEIDSTSFRTSADQLSTLSDDAFVVAVRFLSGERPSAHHAPPNRPYLNERKNVSQDAIDAVLAMEHEDEQIIRIAKALDEAPAAVKDLGDGVTLGLE